MYGGGGADAETQAATEAARGCKPHHRIRDLSGTSPAILVMDLTVLVLVQIDSIGIILKFRMQIN